MSQLDGNAAHMRVAAAMLLTLPGHPFIYYGEELGMRGVKPDPDLREPMRWERAARAPARPRWKALSAARRRRRFGAGRTGRPATRCCSRYRILIHWRSEIGALRDGDIATLDLHSRRSPRGNWTMRTAT